VKTFTVGYEKNPDVSELAYARIVAEQFKTDHHELILHPSNLMDIVSQVVWHLEEPIAEYATIPLMLLSKLAKEHVTVMLSGEGADEIFAGYPIYRIMNGIGKYQKIPATLRNAIFQPLISAFLGNKREGKYVDWLTSPLEKRYLGNGSYFTKSMREKLYSPGFREKVDTDEVLDRILGYYRKVSHKDPISQMLYLDTKTWLPEDLLIKADKMTMAASLELRVPFLDHEMVELATSLPTAMKATMGQSKFILKKYAEELLPHKIVYRKKRGFPVPVKQWLRGELNDVAREVLLDQRSRSRGLFNGDYVERLFHRHSESTDDLSKNIWNLLILEVWFRIFEDGEVPCLTN
ncbi:MAG TPA: asparagine synthase C-terminal domain-containing protein, partial [Syntrophorhabdaceae bacterium]|nr:asparagine synthase C-terminal domain-containing protein [Syntrophorhabdaceae bacterium]